MNAQKIAKISSQIFIGLSILSVGYVALLSLIHPRATMELVGVSLPNNDAISSIRGIYGGGGVVIVVTLLYLLLRDLQKGLIYLSMFWGAYALSRLITILVDEPLESFGSQWIVIETLFCLLGLALALLFRRHASE